MKCVSSCVCVYLLICIIHCMGCMRNCSSNCAKWLCLNSQQCRRKCLGCVIVYALPRAPVTQSFLDDKLSKQTRIVLPSDFWSLHRCKTNVSSLAFPPLEPYRTSAFPLLHGIVVLLQRSLSNIWNCGYRSGVDLISHLWICSIWMQR